MRRVTLLFFVALVVVAGLVVSGVLEVKVNIRPPGTLEAKPFWREVRADGALPPALGVWIEVARVVTPAVVNISTTQRRARNAPGEEFYRRPGPASARASSSPPTGTW